MDIKSIVKNSQRKKNKLDSVDLEQLAQDRLSQDCKRASNAVIKLLRRWELVDSNASITYLDWGFSASASLGIHHISRFEGVCTNSLENIRGHDQADVCKIYIVEEPETLHTWKYANSMDIGQLLHANILIMPITAVVCNLNLNSPVHTWAFQSFPTLPENEKAALELLQTSPHSSAKILADKSVENLNNMSLVQDQESRALETIRFLSAKDCTSTELFTNLGVDYIGIYAQFLRSGTNTEGTTYLFKILKLCYLLTIVGQDHVEQERHGKAGGSN